MKLILLIPTATLALTAGCGVTGDVNNTPAGTLSASSTINHAEDVEITSCSRDQYNYPEATVKVTNRSSKPSTYIVTVAFVSPDGATQYDTGLAAVDNLTPGQTTTKTATAPTPDIPAGFECRIADLTRYAS